MDAIKSLKQFKATFTPKMLTQLGEAQLTEISRGLDHVQAEVRFYMTKATIKNTTKMALEFRKVKPTIKIKPKAKIAKKIAAKPATPAPATEAAPANPTA